MRIGFQLADPDFKTNTHSVNHLISYLKLISIYYSIINSQLCAIIDCKVYNHQQRRNCCAIINAEINLTFVHPCII